MYVLIYVCIAIQRGNFASLLGALPVGDNEEEFFYGFM